jgi:hypothetical protein
MLDKFKIKQFIHNAIRLVWGLQGKIASRYGMSEFWISDQLSETKETDFVIYPYLVFMQHLSELSPETHAMIDDEVRRLMDEMRAKGLKGGVSEPVDTLVENVSAAWMKFQTAYRNRVGKGELKALSAKLGAQNNSLLQALDPPRPMIIGDEKVAKIR